jgi:hypothetical protein
VSEPHGTPKESTHVQSFTRIARQGDRWPPTHLPDGDNDMKLATKILGALALTTFAFANLPIHAGDDDYPNIFVKMCEKSSDGKVSKSEVMKTVEKMFDKHDTRKEGKLDKKQADAFYKAFTRESGG